jgi:ATP-dependent DNA ligase
MFSGVARRPKIGTEISISASSSIGTESGYARHLELDGADLGSSPVEERKQHLAWALRERHHGMGLNATYGDDGAVIYEHACTLGCEGIVSKRLGSPYRAGHTDQWLKMKNSEAPAVRRDREIDWAKR